MSQNSSFVAILIANGLLALSSTCFDFDYTARAEPRAEDLYGAAPKNINLYLDRLMRAYPETISGFDENFLILKNGTRFPISDRRTNKTFEELLEHPDIDDMFFAEYPTGTKPVQPKLNADPGRVRYEPFFTAVYGDCGKNEVAKNLRTIRWLSKRNGGNVSITTVNGVDRALEAVSHELDELPEDFIKYLKPPSGTYNCRTIAGSSAVSMHAYAASIDINAKYSDYWRWSSGSDEFPKWKNQIPMKIVSIFEKHCFIWGGYWYHYDTMHFEYRPEFLPTCDLPNKNHQG